MYYMIFVRIFLILLSFVLIGVLFRGRTGAAFLIPFCLAVLSADMFLFAYLPVPSFRYDTVSVTALGEKNDVAWGNEVFLKSYCVWGAAQDFPKVSAGQWFWMNGMYCWRNENDDRKPADLTRTIELKIPAGIKRELVFSGNLYRGLAEISCRDFQEKKDLYAEEEREIKVALPDSSAGDIAYNDWMKTFYIFLVHLAVCAIVFLLGRLFGRYADTFHRYRYELVFFLLNVFLNIKYMPYPGLEIYGSTQYLIGYEFGFVKRGFLGEIVTWMAPFVSQEALADFKLYFKLFLFFMASVLLGKIIKRQEEEEIRWFFCFLLLALPSTFFFAGNQDMRNDVYPMLLFVVSAVLIARGAMLWLLPVLTTHILLNNETGVVCLLPTLFAMLLYKYVKGREKKSLGALLLAIGCTVPLSLFFMFREDPRRGYAAGQVAGHVQLHAGFPIYAGAIDSDFFPLSKHLHEVMPSYMAGYAGPVLISWLLMVPAAFLCIVICRVLYDRLKQTEAFSRARRFSFIILALSPLCGFAAMVVAYDYGRYSSFMLNAVMAVVFYILYEENLQIRYGEICLKERGGKGFNYMPVTVCGFYLILEELGAYALGMPNLYHYVNFFGAWLWGG